MKKTMVQLSRILIWGHELHSHTHSYIHNAFTRGFKRLGLETHWLRDEPNPGISTDNALIFAHNVACKHLPISQTSYYVFHNMECRPHPVYPDERILQHMYPDNVPVRGIPLGHIMTLQVFSKECKRLTPLPDTDGSGEYKEHLYTNQHVDVPSIYMPWATDLFPDDIQHNIDKLGTIRANATNAVHFVGMQFGPWDYVSEYCKVHDIPFVTYGGTFEISSDRNLSVEENMHFIQKSITAPAVQSIWQVDNMYVPCRIFKNISYGKMGVTNSPTVSEMFDGKLVYDTDIPTMMDKALKFEKDMSVENTDRIINLMKVVQAKHTYLNRCRAILRQLETSFGVTIQMEASK